MFKINRILTVVTMIVAMAAPAWAQVTFDGGPSGIATNWNTAENWNPDGVPTVSSGALTISAKTVDVQTDAPDIQGTLAIQNGAELTINANMGHIATENNSDVTLNGGSIMTQNGGDVYFSDDMRAASGTHNMNGGTFHLRDYYRFDPGTSLLEITGGSFTVGSYMDLLSYNNGTIRIKGYQSGAAGSEVATDISLGSLGMGTNCKLEMVLMNGTTGLGIATIDVTGNAALSGTLDVTLGSGAVLPTGATDYDLIVAGSLSGAFVTTTLPSDDWSISSVGGTTVRLTYTGTSATPGALFYGK